MKRWGLRKSLRHLTRIEEILRTLVKYGFWDVVEKIQVGMLYDVTKRIFPKMIKQEYAALGTAVRLRMVFEELGPTFIKLGQMLSLRPDLIPLSYTEEFTKLQDDVEPESFEQISSLIESSYDTPLSNIFLEFEKIPLAAASIAQVHQAKLKTGQNVAIKILRPNLFRVIETDLDILFRLAKLLEKYIPESQLYNPSGILREFAKTIRKEQNMILEGRNIDIFRRYLSDDETVKIPFVYWEFTREKILVTELIQGIKITDLPALDKAGLDRKQLAINGAKLILKQIFIFGFFHADPHPGNIFALPDNIIAPVDFGMVGRIDDDTQEAMLDILRNILDKDAYRIARILLKLGIVDEQVNFKELQHELLDYLDRYYGLPLNQIDTNRLMNELMELIRDYRIRLPVELSMMEKVLVMSESVGRKLYPDFNMFELLIPFTKKLYYQRLNPIYLYRHFRRMLDESFDLVRDLPEDTRDILRKIRRDQISINFHHRGLENLTRELDRSSNRIAFALIIASIIVGSSFIIQLEKGPLLWGYPFLGIVGYLLATVLGFWLIIAILKSGKL
jgi:ubiquinone biosynthesis protein